MCQSSTRISQAAGQAFRPTQPQATLTLRARPLANTHTVHANSCLQPAPPHTHTVTHTHERASTAACADARAGAPAHAQSSTHLIGADQQGDHSMAARPHAFHGCQHTPVPSLCAGRASCGRLRSLSGQRIDLPLLALNSRQPSVSWLLGIRKILLESVKFVICRGSTASRTRTSAFRFQPSPLSSTCHRLSGCGVHRPSPVDAPRSKHDRVHRAVECIGL